MGKLPRTAYKELLNKQTEMKLNALPLRVVYNLICDLNGDYGYRISTANKWMLNWAVCGFAKFIPIDGDLETGYTISLGDYRNIPKSERMDHNRVWLPTKEVNISLEGKKELSCEVIL